MLPELYQKHLQNFLSESQLLLLTLLINVLQNTKNVKIETIAQALPIPILFQSRRKKVQRFLSIPSFNLHELWLPIIQQWLAQTFSSSQKIYLAIDRTNWGKKNLMVVSLIYEKRAIPIYFELLTKLGSSNLIEQIRILTKIIPIFKDYQTVILGDREFCSVRLASWLDEQGFELCLRLKKSAKIELDGQIWTQLKDLGLREGTSLFLANVNMTKTRQIRGFNLACKWQKRTRNLQVSEGWFILTNLENREVAIAAYKRRFDIEEMFRDFKSGGYNLEDSKAEGDRFIALLILISLAYTLATLQGQILKKKGVQKYVARLKEAGRFYRRHSSFYIGLYAQEWINFLDDCWSIVQALMRLSPQKLENYLRGMRAMELIQSVF